MKRMRLSLYVCLGICAGWLLGSHSWTSDHASAEMFDAGVER